MLKLIKTDWHKNYRIIPYPVNQPVDLSSLWGHSDGTYTFICSDKIEILQGFKNLPPATGTIRSGCKVYFAPDSLVSPLCLSKLKDYNVDIKRVIKPEKADVIVTSSISPYRNDIYATSDYDDQNIRYHIRGWYGLTEKDLEQAKHYCAQQFYFAMKADNVKLAQKAMLMYTYPDKIVYDLDFITYISQFLPEIDDETFNNTLMMLNNSDEKVRELAMTCLQYYNFSNHIYDLLIYFHTRERYMSHSLCAASLSERFVVAALNTNPAPRYHWRTSPYDDLVNIVTKTFNNPMNTQSKDDVANKIINRYLEDIQNNHYFKEVKTALNAIGYTIKLEQMINDQNGETESGN